MKRLVTLIVAIAACWIYAIAPAAAQDNSLYTNRQLRSYQTRNSAAAFTSQRFQNKVLSRVVPKYNFTNTNRNLLDAARGRSKPFANVRPSSPVSPYLALDQPFQNTATTYYTQIRPMQEQQRLNQQMAQRGAAIQQQLNDIAAQGPYDPRGNEGQAPTGHASSFMNFGGYYQMPGPRN
jgi:hypothetical protein